VASRAENCRESPRARGHGSFQGNGRDQSPACVEGERKGASHLFSMKITRAFIPKSILFLGKESKGREDRTTHSEVT